MVSLSLEDWSRIADIVAAIGVIASLIYLAVELRLTRIASEAQLSYSSLEVYSRWRTALVDNSDLARAIAKANNSEALEPNETIQLNAVMDELFYAAAVSHSSTRQSGALHARDLDVDYVVRILSENHGLLAQWKRFERTSEPGFPEFRESVSNNLESDRQIKNETAA
ncbi:MAG: hypothetical protein RIC85_01125 [Gammaproteobacteria bacterium]